MALMPSMFSRVKEIVSNTNGKIIASCNRYALVLYPSEYDRNMKIVQLQKKFSDMEIRKVGNDKVYIDWS